MLIKPVDRSSLKLPDTANLMPSAFSNPAVVSKALTEVAVSRSFRRDTLTCIGSLAPKILSSAMDPSCWAVSCASSRLIFADVSVRTILVGVAVSAKSLTVPAVTVSTPSVGSERNSLAFSSMVPSLISRYLPLLPLAASPFKL